MQVGVATPNGVPGADRESILRWAALADEGPFSTLAVLDRLVYDSLDPFATIASCAAATEDVGLATYIAAAPLRSTAYLAKQAATVDVLSEGRFTLGLGLGAREEDYEYAGRSWGGRGRRFTEQLSELRDYWFGEEVGPTPVQEGGPRILVGGQSDRAFQRVGRYADGYAHGGGPPRVFGRQADNARAAWNEVDRPGEPELWGQGYFALGDDGTVEAGREYLLDYYEFTGSFAEQIADNMLASAQDVVQFLRGYADEGCDQLLLLPAVADVEQLERLEAVVEAEWAGTGAGSADGGTNGD